MKNTSACLALLSAFILTSTASNGEDLETISRPDIAAANCPVEWAALTALETDLWEDTNPIGIDPSLDQGTTNAINKYFLWIMAREAHVASLIGISDPNVDVSSYFDGAKAKYNLSTCLTMTQAERDLVVAAYHAHSPSRPEDRIRARFFDAFDEYECMGLARASAQVFQLNPQSASFQSDYEKIMSTTLQECS
ncbi:hypothetical protein [Yoonia maritima]|uniref:hypothetical protein n=1 Tax=Yoonia maritima TaxID=1435347 RepID=UPI00373580A8